MMVMARAMRLLWLPISLLLIHISDSLYTIALVNAYDRCNQCLAKLNQSAAMLSPNYFFIFCILINNAQKMAYSMNALYIE